MLRRVGNIGRRKVTQSLSHSRHIRKLHNTYSGNFNSSYFPYYSIENNNKPIVVSKRYNHHVIKFENNRRDERRESWHQIRGTGEGGWIFGLFGVVASFVATSMIASAEEDEQEKEEDEQEIGIILITQDNFVQVIEQLKNNDPRIISIEFTFVLSEPQLKQLYEAIQDNTELGYITWHKDQNRIDTFLRLQTIEIKLVNNNKNYRYYPNDYVHALLSTHAYITSKEKDPVLLDNSVNKYLEGWKVEKVYDDTDNTGYYSAIYINDKTHQVVLANRGTEGIIKGLASKNSDWETNLKEIVAAEIVIGQQAWNYLATKEAVELAKKKAYNLSFTGHSLGAWLAELSAYYSYAYFNDRDIKAVTFDSPGSLQMMKKLQSNIKDRDTNITLENIDIVTYLAAPNPVNSCNQHVGKVYRVNREMEITKWIDNKVPDFVKKALGGNLHALLSIEGHMMGGILDTFDPITGKPKESIRMADWPRFEYKGKEKRFKNIAQKFIKNSSLKTKVTVEIIDHLVTDTTIMSMVSLVINAIEGKIDRKQYRAYYESIDIERQDGKSVPRQNLTFDKEFKLIAEAKYREDKDDVTILKPTKGSIDELLYELSFSKDNLSQKQKDLPDTIRKQLRDLAESYEVKQVDGKGTEYKLIPIKDKALDADAIRQRIIRLKEVLPKKLFDVILQKMVVVNKNIFEIEDGKFVIKDKRTHLLLDNIPVEYEHLNFTGRKDKFAEIKEQLEKQPVAIISGEGGVGKSSLVAKYVANLKVSKKVRWISARNGKVVEQYKELANDLQIDTEKFTPEQLRNAVYEKCASLENGILLVIDNIENKEEAKFCLQNVPNNVKLLVTTRHNDLFEGKAYKPIRLERFNEIEKVAYLRSRLEDKSENDIKILAQKVSSLPFDLESVIEGFRKSPSMNVSEYLIKLEKFKDYKYPATQKLLNELGEEAKEILKYCAYLDSDVIPIELLKKVIPDQEKLDKGIIELTETTSLLKKKQDEIFSLHEDLQEAFRYKQNEQETIITLLKGINEIFPYVLSYNKQNYTQAKRLGSSARIIAGIAEKEIMGDDAELAELYGKLGFYYNNTQLYKDSLEYKKKELNIFRALNLKQNQDDFATLLNGVGLAYKDLGNYREALRYFEEALEIRKVLYPKQDHPDVADSLSNVGVTYEDLGDVKKGLKYQKEALIMRKALYPNQNHPGVADSLNNLGILYASLGDTKKELKYFEETLAMYQALYPNKDHPAVARSLNNLGMTYNKLGDNRKGLRYFEEALAIYRGLYPDQNHPTVARSLNSVGFAYQDLGNVEKGLKYQEEALIMRKELYPNQNHPDIANSLNNVGFVYQDLGDKDKALEYYKQAYGGWLALFGEEHKMTKLAKQNIEAMQPDFFTKTGFVQELQKQDCAYGNPVGSECRWLIFSHGEFNEELITLKQKIQSNVLNNISQATNDYGWSSVGALGEWGAKGYTEPTYLKKQLGDLGENQKNLENAQMLCFESMNLGVMKSDKKPYKVVESFCRTNHELVKKISKQHPEFFVDGSIVEVCMRAIPHDKEFAELLKQNVRYMGSDKEAVRDMGRGAL